MGLLKLRVSESLHRRVKGVAVSKGKKIEDYAISVLEEHVPKTITFDDDPSQKKRPKSDRQV